MIKMKTYKDIVEDALLSRVWTAYDAYVHITNTFSKHSAVYYKSEWYQWHEMLNLVGSDTLCLAENMPIYFWGGPPGQRCYRGGTMLDFLYDVCYYEMVENDTYQYLHIFLRQITGQGVNDYAN